MAALAKPILGFLKGGVYTQHDALLTARYFALFSLSLALWSAQGIYARAFYAARNTLTPAISGTLVTLASIPIYAALFHHLGVEGLAIASDLGILAHTLALAVLLHRYRLVSLATLEYPELLRALIAATLAYFVTLAVTTLHLFQQISNRSHIRDATLIVFGTIVWAAVCYVTLQTAGSQLLQQLRRKS